jgi:mono/diheme cytochrome c family protein
MLRKIIKWTLIVFGALVLIVGIVVFSLVSGTNRKLNKKWTVEPAAIPIPSDSASLARGMQRARILCMDCHGEGFAGRELMNDPAIGKIDAHNLTSGRGGIGGKYTDANWIKAIRHGINKDGRALFIMPSSDFHNMSEQDLAEVIAYIKTIPPIDKEWQVKPEITPMAKVLASLGAFGEYLSAEKIDHSAGFKTAPATGPTKEYGGYLVSVFGCTHCHGLELNGGKSPEPHSPLAPNITPGGNPGKWTNEQFHKALITGWTPDGKQLSEYMPWKATANMTADELTAVYNYLMSLPAKEDASIE